MELRERPVTETVRVMMSRAPRAVVFQSKDECSPSVEVAPPSQKSAVRSARAYRRGRLARTVATPPVVVVPKVPKSSRRNQTPRVQPRDDEDLGYATDMRLHPKTPHAQVVADMSPMVQRCLQFADYKIITIKPDGFKIHAPVPAVVKKLESLNYILRIVSDPVTRKSLPQSSIEEIFEMVKLHIFREIPAFRAPNEFSEIDQIYVVKNWDHIGVVHEILRCLMMDQLSFCPLIDKEFTYRLVQQLESPVPEEQVQIENDLRIILESYVGYRTHILHCMLSKLISFLDGVKYMVSSVAPILRLFLSYFNSLQDPIKQSNFLLFRTVFYPLFSTELAYMFERPLHELSAFFQFREPATALWCLAYLKRHWPVSSGRKQMLFFNQFTSLLPALPSTVMERVGPLVLRTVAPCIASEHWQTSLSATLFCSDESFIGVYTPMPEEISKHLIPAARRAVLHWKEEEREIAEDFLKYLSAFEFASKPATRALTGCKKNTTPGLSKWEDVIQMAASNDTTIDADRAAAEVGELYAKER